MNNRDNEEFTEYLRCAVREANVALLADTLERLFAHQVT